MAKIISFISSKGGVGKSLSTILAANILSQQPFNQSVFIADADKQQSIATQRNLDLQSFDGLTPYQVQAMTVQDFFNKDRGIYKLDHDFDFIFLDVAGKLDNNLAADKQEITKYLQVLDFVFIPFISGLFQLSASIEFLKVAMKVKHQRRSSDRPLRVFGFINMFEGGRTLDDKLLLEEIEEIQAMLNIEFLESKLNRYALFRGSNTLVSFYEEDAKGKPEQNLKAWFDEFYKIVK